MEVEVRACDLLAEIKSERMAFAAREMTGECN